VSTQHSRNVSARSETTFITPPSSPRSSNSTLSSSPGYSRPLTRLHVQTLRQAQLVQQAAEQDPAQAHSFIFEQELPHFQLDTEPQSTPNRPIPLSVPTSHVPLTLTSASRTPDRCTPDFHFQFQFDRKPKMAEQLISITPMPGKNHASAPKFDTSHPHELPAYFDELEALLSSA
jgi:hypothetical protein